MNRKELVRAYKERRPPMGVYQVKNTITGHTLVAASRDLQATLNRHEAQLRMGAHPSRALQAAWQQHGRDSFVFEVLDTLAPPEDSTTDPIEDLATLEDLWLERLSLRPDRIHTINPRRLR